MKKIMKNYIKISIIMSILMSAFLMSSSPVVEAATEAATANHFVADAGVKNYIKLEIKGASSDRITNVQLHSITTGWKYTLPTDKIWVNPADTSITHVWLEENWMAAGESYEFLTETANIGFHTLSAMPQFESGKFTNGNSYYSINNNGSFAFAVSNVNIDTQQLSVKANKFVADAGIKNYIKVEYELSSAVPLSKIQTSIHSKTTGWSMPVPVEKVWQNPANQRILHVWLEENWFSAGETYDFQFSINNGTPIIPDTMTTTDNGAFLNKNTYKSLNENAKFYFSVVAPVITNQKFTHQTIRHDSANGKIIVSVKEDAAEPISQYKTEIISKSNFGRKVLPQTAITQIEGSQNIQIAINVANIIPEETYTLKFTKDGATKPLSYSQAAQTITVNGSPMTVTAVNNEMTLKLSRKNGMYAITAAEQNAITKYQDNGVAVNKALRSGNPGQYQAQINSVISGLTKLNNVGYRNLKTVYRGMRELSEADINKIFPGVGSYYTDKGFISTTLNQTKAVAFADGEGQGRVHLIIKNSHSGTDLVQYQETQSHPKLEEVLFKPNTKFKILSKVKNSYGTWKITVEEDPNTIFNYA